MYITKLNGKKRHEFEREPRVVFERFGMRKGKGKLYN